MASKNDKRVPYGSASSRALACAKSQLGATVSDRLWALAEAHRQDGNAYMRSIITVENVFAVAGIPAARIPVLCSALRRGKTAGMDWRKELGLAKDAGAKAIIAGFPAVPTIGAHGDAHKALFA